MKSSWNHEDDVVSVTFDGNAVERSALREVIIGLGYYVEEVTPPAATRDRVVGTRVTVPEAAPNELREAFARAGAGGRLVVVDFRATWCAPCIKLEKTTLADAKVKKLLERAALIHVDLDEHPALGKLWGVASVPDVLFFAPDGLVVDRFREYEEAEPFASRLEAAIRAVESRRHPK